MKYSIIIPTFNRAQVLPEVLQSVNKATVNYESEIIVIDDGSTDNTGDLLADYNITYIKLDKPSGGPAYPRNFGASIAKGEYLCFLDSDDFWKENKLIEVDRIVSQYDVDFLYHSFEGHHARSLSFMQILYRNEIVTSSVVIRRSVFEEMDGFNISPDLKSVEDYDLWIRIFQRDVLHIMHISKSLGYYSMSLDRISDNAALRRVNCKALWKTHFRKLSRFEKFVFILGLSRVYMKNMFY